MIEVAFFTKAMSRVPECMEEIHFPNSRFWFCFAMFPFHSLKCLCAMYISDSLSLQGLKAHFFFLCAASKPRQVCRCYRNLSNLFHSIGPWTLQETCRQFSSIDLSLAFLASNWLHLVHEIISTDGPSRKAMNNLSEFCEREMDPRRAEVFCQFHIVNGGLEMNNCGSFPKGARKKAKHHMTGVPFECPTCMKSFWEHADTCTVGKSGDRPIHTCRYLFPKFQQSLVHNYRS